MSRSRWRTVFWGATSLSFLLLLTTLLIRSITGPTDATRVLLACTWLLLGISIVGGTCGSSKPVNWWGVGVALLGIAWLIWTAVDGLFA